MTYKMNQKEKMFNVPESVYMDIDFGGRTCHECFKHCCNDFRLGYAKDHCCGNPWTYRLHTFCPECYGDGPTKENVPADSIFIGEKLQ